jgi:hypothetical protein
MPLSAGDKFGPDEILDPLGQGGMGEVYRAKDPRLSRDVAIKGFAPQFSKRLEREAHAVAALNHPNICHLYDVGPDYLVMGCVEGQDWRGPLILTTRSSSFIQLIDGIKASIREEHYPSGPAQVLWPRRMNYLTIRKTTWKKRFVATPSPVGLFPATEPWWRECSSRRAWCCRSTIMRASRSLTGS